jgi:hypothetical protein
LGSNLLALGSSVLNLIGVLIDVLIGVGIRIGAKATGLGLGLGLGLALGLEFELGSVSRLGLVRVRANFFLLLGRKVTPKILQRVAWQNVVISLGLILDPSRRKKVHQKILG